MSHKGSSNSRETAWQKDFSTDFHLLRRVVNSELRGTSYIERRQTMKPRYLVVWSDVAFSLFLVALSMIGAGRNEHWLMVPFWAACVGLSLHRVSLFLHEGAHFNLASSHSVNDAIADLLISPLVLTSVASYRPGHMLHHRLLGTPDDPERSYQSRLNLRFVAAGLFGWRVLDVVRMRESSASGGRSVRSRVVPLGGAVLYVGLTIRGVVAGEWRFCAALCAGVMSIFPLVGSLRQLLEHRAGADEFLTEEKNAVSRLFPVFPCGWLLGAAGFNRHLLHHWDPGVSYTRLRDLEQLVSGTSVLAILNHRRRGYVSVFSDLWRMS